MIAETGRYALILALFVAAVQGCAPMMRASLASRAAYLQFALIALAFAAFVWLFATSDFSVAAVVANSHSDKPLLYKIAGSWGNHEGSLLLWTLILAGLGAVFAWREPAGCFRSHALAVLGALGFGFVLTLLFASDPFARLDPVPIDGDGLNPLLQDIGLVFHPPLLYLGYVGAALPFAAAAAALIEGRFDAVAARSVRRWALLSWSFLTVGIAIGAWWSYYTLGWGGFWAWDPVENASLMPWLLATALIHSARASDVRGSLKSWTLLLAILVFSLSLVGTFLVRSGTVASVHAFASDPTRGLFILTLAGVIVGGALALFAWRGRQRRNPPFAPLSRDGAIAAGTALLAFACGVVLVGTLYPMASAALGLGAVAVAPSFFNTIFALLCLPLLLLMAVAPLLAWRRGRLRHGFARMAWSQRLAHFGLMAMVVGILLSAVLSNEATAALRPGESLSVGGYSLRLDRVRESRGVNYDALIGDFTVTKDGEAIAEMHPSLHAFANPPMAKAEIAIRTDLLRDLHVIFAAPDQDGRYGVRAMVKPAMPLVFFGMALMGLGGLLALLRAGGAAPATVAASAGRRRFVAGYAVIAGFAVLALVLAAALWRGEGPVSGTPVPKLTMPALNGGAPLRLEDFDGPVVVNVFASWCAPCRAEHPVLMRLAERVRIVGIASRDKPEAVRAMLRHGGNPYAAVGLDAGRAGDALGITGVPETLLIEDGTIVWRHVGPLDDDIVAAELLSLLARAR